MDVYQLVIDNPATTHCSRVSKFRRMKGKMQTHPQKHQSIYPCSRAWMHDADPVLTATASGEAQLTSGTQIHGILFAVNYSLHYSRLPYFAGYTQRIAAKANPINSWRALNDD